MATPESVLNELIKSASIPGISYGRVKVDEGGQIERRSSAVGVKNAESTSGVNTVTSTTKFPASSLSKVVFSYLVIKLAKAGVVNLDEPLHDILPNQRMAVKGEFPQKALKLTARHVLSHTSGLPNFGSGSSETLTFSEQAALGKGYSYSGEAFLYLQKAIEKKTGKDLETLAQEYVFVPLQMHNSTFSPDIEDDELVNVHSELGHPSLIYVGEPAVNAAGSLVTTGGDFTKFMGAWLANMRDPLFKQAVKPTDSNALMTCGLGWHIYRDENEDLIAYQFGENPNTRAFVAINLTEGVGAAYFTNSENGMSIVEQMMRSPDLLPIANLKQIYDHLNYTQSSTPGYSEVLAGRIAESKGDIACARRCFEAAYEKVQSLSVDDIARISVENRLDWFNQIHDDRPHFKPTRPIEGFIGTFRNPYNDQIKLFVQDDNLVFKEFNQEIKLRRVSENEFLPLSDQSFKITLNDGEMKLEYVQGFEKSLVRQPEPKSPYKEAIKTLRNGQDEPIGPCSFLP